MIKRERGKKMVFLKHLLISFINNTKFLGLITRKTLQPLNFCRKSHLINQRRCIYLQTLVLKSNKNLVNDHSETRFAYNDYEDESLSANKLNEDLYWDRIRDSMEQNEDYEDKYKQTSAINKNVFVLQLKMQYKSKARQSTTADLQLAESVALVQTLSNWRVVDSLVISSKNSNSKEIFGSGNQEILSKKIAESGCNCLFVVIDQLTNLQVKNLRRTLLAGNEEIQIYDRYKIVLEIFKRNARSSIAKLQIALAEIPYIRHKYDNKELYKNVEKRIKRELEAKLKTKNMLNTQRHDKNIPLVSVFGYESESILNSK